MMAVHSTRVSRGVITLFVSVIVLLLVTLMVAMAVKLSATNLLAVGNVQTRTGALAAAEKVIGEVIDEGPGVATFHIDRREQVDINLDGSSDFSVVVTAPRCVRAMPAASDTANSVTLEGFSYWGRWNTVWEIHAVAHDEITQANVSVVHGVRYFLTGTEKDAYCS